MSQPHLIASQALQFRSPEAALRSLPFKSFVQEELSRLRSEFRRRDLERSRDSRQE